MQNEHTMHRIFSLIAAFLVTITASFTLHNSLLYFSFTALWDSTLSVLKALPAFLISIAVAFMLIRGKKDKIAGIAFVLEIALSLFYIVSSLFSMDISLIQLNIERIFSLVGDLCIILAEVLYIAFFAMLAVECFLPGKISGKKILFLALILIPLPIIVLEFGSLLFWYISWYGDRLGYIFSSVHDLMSSLNYPLRSIIGDVFALVINILLVLAVAKVKKAPAEVVEEIPAEF